MDDRAKETILHAAKCMNACRNIANPAAIPRALKEFRHLVALLEPVEKERGLGVPGLATLNGARAALAALEETE